MGLREYIRKRGSTRSSSDPDPTTRPKRSRGALPAFVEPELATLRDAPPEGDGWLHEMKYDGYRTQAHVSAGKVRWLSRNGLDWTERFAPLTPAIEKLGASSAILDGEVVVLDEKGVSSFALLQAALSQGRGRLTYYVFDLLFLDGRDLRSSPLVDRKRALKKLLGRRTGPVRFGDHVFGAGDRVLATACRMGLEGIVSKRATAPYRSGRGLDWIKTKCGLRQEFVVAGYTAPRGTRVELGALVLGVNEAGGMRYVGRVGAGFSDAVLRDLRARLSKLERERPPFSGPIPTAARRGVTWVEPRLVVEVAFTGWTGDGLLRHPTFEGLREDKAAAEVVRERPRSSPRKRGKANRAP